MNKTQIAIRIPSSLFQELNKYVEHTGESKTEVVIQALSNHLGYGESLPIIQRLAQLEQRLAELEAAIKSGRL